ncbi:MAG: response regulator [Proteobacteria bacterium]|nr:response regulator [Pseudomonadota bacterium]MBU4471464.1 response regulator [Pseudomonadota bacterium]MCG2752470.1 response regulator [Desulfobacteraceae bacterium]
MKNNFRWFADKSNLISICAVATYIAMVFLSLFVKQDFLRFSAILFQISVSCTIILFLLVKLFKAQKKNKSMGIRLGNKRNQLSTLMNMLPDMVWLTDDQGRYSRVNRVFADEIDLPESMILGKTSDQVWSRDTADKLSKYDDIVLSKNKTVQYEKSLKDANGNQGWLEINKTPIVDDNKNIAGFIGIARDISGRKNAEDERKELAAHLRQSQKLEAIGTLAGGIAHDFNNILAAIMGYTEITISEITPDNPLYKRMERVLKAAHRGKDLVNQILTFSRQHEQQKQLVKMDLIVEEALALLCPIIPKSIQILSYNSCDVSTIYADPSQIHQVLMNLCTNSAYAMREKGGNLDLRIETCDLDESNRYIYEGLPAGKYVRLTVSDTGPGIDPRIANRIFEPFFTTKKLGEGSGMGLSVVHGIIKSLNGAIILTSEPDKGATFQIVIPKEEEVLKEEQLRSKLVSSGNERILFVDDEESIAEMAGEMLEKLGYEVISLQNSMEALDIFQKQHAKFNLVVTDLTMPFMSGEELAKEILRIRSDMPIIMCTGFSEVVSPEKAKKIGVKEYIMKPFLHEELAATIRKVLDTPSA